MIQAPDTRVLVVGDSAVGRRVISSVLEVQHDMVVVGTAGDGAEAVEATRRLRPDVVVIDTAPPCPDGVDTLRRLRAQRLWTPTVIFCTLAADVESLVAAIERDLLARVRGAAAGGLLVPGVHQHGAGVPDRSV